MSTSQVPYQATNDAAGGDAEDASADEVESENGSGTPQQDAQDEERSDQAVKASV